MKAYFVATIRDIDIEGTRGTRVVGYYTKLKDAKQCIEENWGDIYEDGYYKYAVIEDVQPGLYMSCESTPIFYQWDKKEKKFKQIDRPSELKGYFGFTIG